MATRNRTLIFRKYRDALKSVRIPTRSSSSAAAKSSGGGPVFEMVSISLLHPNRFHTPLSTEDPGNSSKGATTVGLPPAWVDVSEEIATNVQCVQTKMAELSKAHAKALMPSFGDGKENQCNIEALTNDITNLLKKSEGLLQRLNATGPSDDSNIRKNVQRSFATDLQNLSMELRKKQSTYLKGLRQQKEGQDGVDLEMNLNGNRSKAQNDALDDMVFNEHQMAKLKKKKKVVESVNEVAQIMKDLSVLLTDQVTIVDRIDYNIQMLQLRLKKASKSYKRRRERRKEEAWRCVLQCYYVLCHVGPPNIQGDNLLICKQGDPHMRR
ncbi:hypothetical protein PTKIN_Ptkin01aG0351700 [Pterospermum kingtungense]